MDSYSYEIISALKAQYIAICGQKKFQTQKSSIKESVRQFYLKELEDNLIEPMTSAVIQAYNKGNGKELSDKMLALRSSSAMTYNLLGNGDINICGDNTISAGQYAVSFEKQFNTLRNSVGGFPANLDAFLYCKENQEAIACEMKMAEWIFNHPSTLRKAYLLPENYENHVIAKAFIEAANKLIILHNDSDTQQITLIDEYASAFKQYDAIQMKKHALACYNACREKLFPIKKLTLVNCVWELPDLTVLNKNNQMCYKMQLEREHQEFESFYFAMKPVISLFREAGIVYDIRYYSLSEFMQIMSLSDHKKQYLKRYSFQ
jgi:hypothetical protein